MRAVLVASDGAMGIFTNRHTDETDLKLLGQSEIQAYLQANPEFYPADLAAYMIIQAVEKGSQDNISVVAGRV